MPDLSVIDAEPLGGSIIAILEEALLKAQRGELSSAAVAFVHRDGVVGWNWSEAPNTSTLIGAIERMKADLIRHCDEV